MAPFDWPGLLRLGVHRLGLSPDAFWALTPAEFWLLLGDVNPERPMSRDRLDALMDAFPDAQGEEP